jgi:hypothetical protein
LPGHLGAHALAEETLELKNLKHLLVELSVLILPEKLPRLGVGLTHRNKLGDRFLEFGGLEDGIGDLERLEILLLDLVQKLLRFPEKLLGRGDHPFHFLLEKRLEARLGGDLIEGRLLDDFPGDLATVLEDKDVGSQAPRQDKEDRARFHHPDKAIIRGGSCASSGASSKRNTSS